MLYAIIDKEESYQMLEKFIINFRDKNSTVEQIIFFMMIE
jgi:hypothetical protein